MRLSDVENFYLAQLRPHGINNDVIEWMASVPLHQCMPSEREAFAYCDQGLLLPQGRRGLQPFEMGLLLEALEPKTDQSVLEVGTSSGYLTALLAKRCCSVLCVEPSVDEAHRVQKQVLDPLAIKNAHCCEGNAYTGWRDETYGIILINGAVPFVPDTLRSQLTIGGRLFVVLGKDIAQKAVLIRRESQERYTETVLFETCIDAYPGAVKSSGFAF